MSSASGPAFGALYTSDQLPHNGRTGIGIASARGDLEEVERLIEAGSSPSALDEYLETPLHLACCFGHLNIAKILIKEHSVAVDPKNWEGWTPLCFAVARGHFEILKYLLRSKADGQWVSPHGWQLMHLAAWYNQAEMVEWLASHGAPTSVLTAHNRRPFDMTRPGKTRCTLYQAMLDDTKK